MHITLTGHPDQVRAHLQSALRALDRGDKSISWVMDADDLGERLPTAIRFVPDSHAEADEPLYSAKEWR